MNKTSEINKKKRKRNECFVIMPFSDQDGYDPGHFTRVYEDIIVPGCKKAGLLAFRGDSTGKPNIIHIDIVQQLIQAKIAICDLSARNPNVMFELGIRQAFRLPTVLISDLKTPAIFDVAPIRCFRYNSELRYRDVLNDQDRLAKVIKETLDSKSRIPNSILEMAKIDGAVIPASAKKGDKTSDMLRIVLQKIDSMSKNPFGMIGLDGGVLVPMPGLGGGIGAEAKAGTKRGC